NYAIAMSSRASSARIEISRSLYNMAKKYVVDLSEDEVAQLQSIIKKGKHKARTITRNFTSTASRDRSNLRY
ncbi:hypothetical protein CEN47_23590, partial [Fischerella thermalis CCMEE 5319]